MSAVDVSPGDVVELEGQFGQFKVISVVDAPSTEGRMARLELFSTEARRVITIHSPPVVVKKVLNPLERLKGGQLESSHLFNLHVDALRLKYAHTYEPLSTISSTKIEVLPHQVEAVYKMLNVVEPRFLLADDAGLGKTIMAGMLLKELKLRDKVRRTLIAVPASLQYQWKRELNEKFSEDFTIMRTDYIRGRYGYGAGERNPWQEENQAIASIDYLRRDEVREQLKDVYWDLVIIDEAHKMAVHGSGQDIDYTKRFRVGEMLASNAGMFLMLTATPHSGDNYAFWRLVSLADPYLFSTEYDMPKEKLHQVMIRRIKEDVRKFNGDPLFPSREANTLTVKFAEEAELYERVTRYVRLYFNRASAQKNRGVSFAMIILQRRLASSIAAIRKSLVNRAERLRSLRAMRAVLSAQIGAEELESLRDEWEGINELDEKEKEELERKVVALTLARNLPELDSEINELNGLINLAQGIKTDAKAEYMLSFVKSLLERDPNEKMLIFTEFVDTLDFLEQEITTKLGLKIARIDGSMSIEERTAQEELFRSNGINLMVATDAAGEGLNLQFARILINYELPWNPNRLEQRIGRLHRIGQNRKVLVYNIIVENTIEGRVFQILIGKINAIKQHLGERVFDVLGQLLADVNIEELVMQAASNEATFSTRMSIISSIIDQKANLLLRELEQNSLILDQLDIEPIRVRVRASARESVTGWDVERFVRRYLAVAGGKLDDHPEFGSGIYAATLPGEVTHEKAVRNRMIWRTYESGIEKMMSKPITFQRELARAYGTEIEFVSLGHPILNAVIKTCTSASFGGRVTTKYDRLGRTGVIFVFTQKLMENRISRNDQKIKRETIFMVFYDLMRGTVSSLHPKAIWDFEDISKPPGTVPAEMLDKLDDGYTKSEALANGNFSKLVEEAQAGTEREVGIKIEDAKKWLSVQTAQIQRRVNQYRLRGDKESDITIRGENARLAEVNRSYNDHIRELKEELVLVPDGPYLEAVAVILPREDRREGGLDYETKREIELAGMRVAMEFEKDSGRAAKDVSPEFRGYDILSSGQTEERFIEVKSFKGSGSLEITSNEWIMAEKLGPDYWLYIVENSLDTGNEVLSFIQNPSEALRGVADLKELYETRIIVKDWKPKASTEGRSSSAPPSTNSSI